MGVVYCMFGVWLVGVIFVPEAYCIQLRSYYLVAPKNDRVSGHNNSIIGAVI